MAESKKERWNDYLAITTVLIAVCATLSTFKGGGYSTKSLMNQTQASDQWAFYQAKSTKENLYHQERDNLELQRATLAENKASAELLAKYDSKIADCTKKMDKYSKEQTEIKAKATQFEVERDSGKAHSTVFGIAVIFLQISILLSSIAALSKKKFVWYCSLVLGVIGIFYFINGFFLFV
jgi:heme/copper-type cytochrome/quinol oxidase subunit 4